MEVVATFLGLLGIAGAGALAYFHLKSKRAVPIVSAPEIAETEPEAKQYKGPFDKIIEAAASLYGFPPYVLKAIVAKESSFKPEAINPEKSFTFQGVSYSPSDSVGRARLRAFIMAGGEPASLGLNPSIGLAQVRVSIARKILNSPGLTSKELFQPEMNLRASAALLAELFDGGVTLDTIDAYNVGADLSPRNFSYRDAVNRFVRQFQGDF